MAVLGVLWSGTLPVWPPPPSPAHAVDNIMWVVLFVLIYGAPVLSLGLMFLGRRKKQG